MKLENPTSRDIADIAGVSQATVSRALRNSPLVREETRLRIHRIATELNYFVNRNAAGLRSHQSKTIALLMFDDSSETEEQGNPFLLSMLNNIVRAAAELGYDVLLSLQQLHDNWHHQFQASHKADGLVILGYGDFAEYREKLLALAAAKTHFMMWGPIVEDLPGHSLGCDNHGGARLATQHLIKLGRKRIAFVGTRRMSPEIRSRYDGYTAALRAAGHDIRSELQVAAENSVTRGYQATEELLRRDESIDAIFCSTDMIAVGAIRALQNAGLRIPGDVAVVGFDDMPLAEHVTPALTTIRQDAMLGSRGLVEGLVGLIEGRPVKSRLLQPTLIIRESCGGLSV